MDKAQQLDEEVRYALKTLKALNSTLKVRYENQLHIALALRDDLIIRNGEGWHQLALRSIERVNYDEAASRFARAKASLDISRQPHAYARVLRDEAWLAAHHLGEIDRGLELIGEALTLHELDLAQARGKRAKLKGHRQELISKTYGWRIAHLANGHQHPLAELLRVIEHEGYSFCERDQLAIIRFLIPRVGIEERLRLQLRASQLNAAGGLVLQVPYRVGLRTISIGLSSLRWLGRTTRKG